MPRLTLQYLKFNQILFANLTIAGEFSNRIKKKKICWRIWNHFVRKNGYKTIWIFTLYLKFITIALGQDVPFKVKFWRSFKNSINISFTVLSTYLSYSSLKNSINIFFNVLFNYLSSIAFPFGPEQWLKDGRIFGCGSRIFVPKLCSGQFPICPDQGCYMQYTPLFTTFYMLS